MFRTLLRLLVGTLALVGAVALVVVAWFAWGGIGSRPTPSAFETTVARAARSRAIPAVARRRVNPVAATAENVREGMQHFADHCAVCHANNGSGDTLYGRGMYPRPPDLRAADTQQLSDGELFYIIENGVKLTGMPAFGDGTSDGMATWDLVNFIRHLPKITPEDLTRMEQLNPRPPTKSDHDSRPHKH